MHVLCNTYITLYSMYFLHSENSFSYVPYAEGIRRKFGRIAEFGSVRFGQAFEKFGNIRIRQKLILRHSAEFGIRQKLILRHHYILSRVCMSALHQ